MTPLKGTLRSSVNYFYKYTKNFVSQEKYYFTFFTFTLFHFSSFRLIIELNQQDVFGKFCAAVDGVLETDRG